MSKKVLVIGGSGTIGSAVVKEIAPTHEALIITRSTEPAIDLANTDSIQSTLEVLFKEHGHLEGIISCAGGGMVSPIAEMDLEEFLPKLSAKLLGQVALVQYGARCIRPGGAIVLTTGVLAERPMPSMGHLAVINAGVSAFARTAALEYPDLRTCVVSPGLVEESPPNVLALFEGMSRVSSSEIGRAYSHALEHGVSGETYAHFGV